MLNSCILVGNMGADPEIYYGANGDPVASFDIAFRSSKKKTCWIRCVAFKKLAEATEKYLHKGARLCILGTLDVNRWETDEGVQRSSF